MKKIKKFKFNDRSDEKTKHKEKTNRSSKKKMQFAKEEKYRNFKKYLEEE